MSLKIRYENAAALGIMGGLLGGFFLFCVALGSVDTGRSTVEDHPFIKYQGTLVAIMLGGFILSLLLVLYNVVYYIVKKKPLHGWELLKILFWGIVVSACVCAAGIALMWPGK